MDYKTRRFKQGLSGQKPSSFYFDKAAYVAQQAGYRAYLTNRDLADQIARRREADNTSSSDYETSPPKPLVFWQRSLWFGIGVWLIVFDVLISMGFADYTASHAQQHSDVTYWVTFVLSVLAIPGGILGWIGYVLISQR